MTAPGTELATADGSRRYVIERPLGIGAQGTVLLVRDRATGEACAAKVFHRDALQMRVRIDFLVRANLGALSPAILGPTAALVGPSLGYLMPYCSGTSLDAQLAAPWWSLLEGLAIIATVAGSLVPVHARGWAHGDIAPANILVDRTTRTTSITDVDNLAAPGELAEPELLGHKSALAPEMFSGARPSVATELFALAMLAAWVLLLRDPFSGTLDADPSTLARARALRAGWHEDIDARPACGFPLGILSRRIVALIRAGLSPNPAERPPARDLFDSTMRAIWHVHRCGACQVDCINDDHLDGCPNCGADPGTLVLDPDGADPVDLSAPRTTLGRRLLGDDDTVSREHAVVRRRGIEWVLEDRSANGTWYFARDSWRRVVRGKGLVLGPGDVLRFGKHIHARVRAVRVVRGGSW